MLGFDVSPDIFVCPVNDWIANPPAFHTAVLQYSAVIVIIQQNAFFFVLVRFFKKRPTVPSRCTFCPADTGRDKSIFATILFQHRTTIANQPGRWHEFLRNQAPHSYMPAFVARHIDSAGDPFFLKFMERFPDMIDRFGRVSGSMIVNDFKWNFCPLHQS